MRQIFGMAQGLWCIGAVARLVSQVTWVSWGPGERQAAVRVDADWRVRFTLWDLTLETGQWGDQIKWVWLISPINDPDNYVKRGSEDRERELWQFTKGRFAEGRAREWAEALMGRELQLGESDDSDLLRHRMIAYLTHKPKKSDPTVKRETISEGSARPFRRGPAAAFRAEAGRLAGRC